MQVQAIIEQLKALYISLLELLLKIRKAFPCPLVLADFSSATLFRCDKNTFISFVCSNGNRKILKKEIGNEEILGLVKSVEASGGLEFHPKPHPFSSLFN